MAIVITSTTAVRAVPTRWQQTVQAAIRDPAVLCERLGLPISVQNAARRAASSFPLFVPEPFVQKMRPGDPSDPLLRQVLPLSEELDETAGFSEDPVGDRGASIAPGMLQKYSGRALLITTGACAVHCRYCFRRHFPYRDGPRGSAEWRSTLDRLAADDQLHEVILSGGDPLMMTDRQLAALVEQVSAVPHVRRLRVHTRLPIMIPERVTDSLVRWLRGTRLTPLVVIHANHPRELDDAVGSALTRLMDHGIPVLNQSVLLRGVNDQLETLIELSQRLVDCRVMPYYLHRLDPVRGAAHFAVPESRGKELVEAMRRVLPGYAVPRYVQETPGTPHKQLLA